jgi:hypothetical protein
LPGAVAKNSDEQRAITDDIIEINRCRGLCSPPAEIKLWLTHTPFQRTAAELQKDIMQQTIPFRLMAGKRTVDKDTEVVIR